MTRVDGRPWKVDVQSHLDRDACDLLISGLAAGWLSGATITAPIRTRGSTTQVGQWAVTADAAAGTVTLSLAQAAAHAVGVGVYDWVLLITLQSGAKPALLEGTLTLTRSGRTVTRSSPVQVTLADTGATFTFEQVLGDGVQALDGGDADGTGGDSIDGGDA